MQPPCATQRARRRQSASVRPACLQQRQQNATSRVYLVASVAGVSGVAGEWNSLWLAPSGRSRITEHGGDGSGFHPAIVLTFGQEIMAIAREALCSHTRAAPGPNVHCNAQDVFMRKKVAAVNVENYLAGLGSLAASTVITHRSSIPRA